MNIPNLIQNPLFNGLNENELSQLLKCLNPKLKNYQKNETIIKNNDSLHEIGILISGEANIVKYDYWGNSSIITHLYSGEVFGEAYACIPENEVDINVIATENCQILFLDIFKISTACPCACSFHHLIIKNLLAMIAKKNIILNKKVDLMAKKTIREKVLAYLSSQALISNSKIFNIPYNRNQLAEYLGVDRSALSSELSKMQKDGLISYYRNTFKLLI